MLLPILIMAIACAPVRLKLGCLLETKLPLARYMHLRALLLFIGLIWAPSHKAYYRARGGLRRARGKAARVMAPFKSKALEARRQATRGRAEKLSKALRLWGGGMTRFARFGLGCRLALLLVLGPLGLGTPLSPVPGPDIIPADPQKRRPRPSTSMIPGVVDGKNHSLDFDTDHSAVPDIWTWRSKYAHSHIGDDGSINYHIDRPFMEDTGKVDSKTGKPIQKKSFAPFWWRFIPRLLLISHDVAPFEKEAILGTETRTRDKILEMQEEEREIVMPKGDIRKEKIQVPIYEMETVDGPGGPVERRVQEEYIHYIKGEKPGEIIQAFKGDIEITIKAEKQKIKESMQFFSPEPWFKWNIQDCGEIQYDIQMDPDAPNFGGILIKDDTGMNLGASIPAPNGRDAKGKEIPCHWRLDMDERILALEIDADLSRKEWKAPFTLDPSVTWDGTKIEISGNGNTLASMKTLYEEGFNNATDGTALDTYDANWVVTKAGTSVAEIDTAQFHSGNSSLLLYRDGANDVTTINDAAGDYYDNVRFTKWVRTDITIGRLDWKLYNSAGQVICFISLMTDGHIWIFYGNGAGGTFDIDCGAYAANTWYQLMIDVNVTNDKYRGWINGVLWPSSAADAGGWSNFGWDYTAMEVDRFGLLALSGTGSYWIDDITIEIGDEIYANGNLPYNPNEISEDVSPTGTLSGVDGDWASYKNSSPSGLIAVDSTKEIIGTNSIKGTWDNASGTEVQTYYNLDSPLDITNLEGLELYFQTGFTATSGILIKLYDYPYTGLWQWNPVCIKDKWNHLKLDFPSCITKTGDLSKIKTIIIASSGCTEASGSQWVDGLHFYGARNGRGASWAPQSIQTKSGTTTQLNRSVPSPARNHKVNEKNSYWISCNPFEANGNDFSGKGHDFAASSAPAYAGNPIYGGTHARCDLDGADDEYHITTDDFLTTAGALAIWIEPDTIAAGTDSIWCIWAADNDRVYLRRNGASLELVHNIDAATTTYWLGTLVADRAFHCTWAWDGVNWTFWLDGKQVLYVANVKTPNDIASGANTYIGCHKSGGATADFWDGHIWDFQFYNSNLGLGQDSRCLLAGAGKDLYIDDSKGISGLSSGLRYELGRRWPEEPNELCEATTDWTGTSITISSLSDAAYGTKSIRGTKTATTGYIKFHAGYDWNIDLQKIVGANSTNPRSGKLVFWAKASETLQLTTLDFFFGGVITNYVETNLSQSITTYWKKYEFDLNRTWSTSGTVNWADIDCLWIYSSTSSIGSTIDINDLHFEERCSMDRSTTSGYYDLDDGGEINLNYFEIKNSAYGIHTTSGATGSIKHGTISNGVSFNCPYLENTTPLTVEDIRDAPYSSGMWPVWGGTFKRIQIEALGYDFYIGAGRHISFINSIVPLGGGASYTGSAISYNHNNVQGTHKMWGTPPFSGSSVSDFPRSKNQWVNSTKGWTLGAGTIEQVQGNSILVTNDDGAQASPYFDLALSSSLDLGASGDSYHPNNMKIKIKTSGADAAWDLECFISSAGWATDFSAYKLSRNNDIDTTETWDMSGDGYWNFGATNKANINYIRLKFTNIASAAEKVRMWVEELYGETDAGKVYMENNSITTAFAVDNQAGATLALDSGFSWTWDDTASAGFGASAGSLVCLGTSGSRGTMTSAATPPANYWDFDTTMSITADYSDFKYYASPFSCSTRDINQCSFQYAGGANPAVVISGTNTQFDNISIANADYGLRFDIDAIVDHITISGITPGHWEIQCNGGGGARHPEMKNSEFDPAEVDFLNWIPSSGLINKDRNSVNGEFYWFIPSASYCSWGGWTNSPDSGDNIYFYMEMGASAGDFNFNAPPVTTGDLTVQAGKAILLKWNNAADKTYINGSVFNAYTIEVQDNVNIEQSAVLAGHDIYFIWQSNANTYMSLSATGGKWKIIGSSSYHCYWWEINRASVSGNLITDLGPVNPITISGGTLEATYAHILHMENLLQASSLILTDSEYWFVVASAPEEHIVAGTWTLIRSLISSYSSLLWYIKPTGTISLTDSLLDNLLPTIYSSNYYIIFWQLPSKMVERHRARNEVITQFIGGQGEYSEVSSFDSSYVEVEGRASYDDLALWDHALDHRIFVARLRALKREKNELIKFCWHKGYFPIALLSDFENESRAGEAFGTACEYWKVKVSERPYNT